MPAVFRTTVISIHIDLRIALTSIGHSINRPGGWYFADGWTSDIDSKLRSHLLFDFSKCPLDFIPYLLSRLAQHQKIHFRVRRTFLIGRELAVIIKCAPDYGPGVWTVIASSLTRRSGWFFLFISIQTPLWAHRRRNKYSYRQQNKEE